VKRQLLIALAFVSTTFGQIDPKGLVEQSVRNYTRDWHEGMSWSYTVTDITYSDGVKHADVSEVTPLEGTPYERLVQKDGEPLSPAEQHKEKHKYERTLRQRENETPEEREARIQKYQSDRAFIRDIPNAFSFALEGEEPVEGRPAWVVRLTPLPGFVPATPHASMLQHLDGKLWIDKEDVQWAKAEAHVRDTISIGWFVARIGPGASITLKQQRVADGLWLPEKAVINGVARLFVVHSKKLDEQITWSGYHKDTSPSAERREKSVSGGTTGEKSFR
jgi:hypothetical protein